MRFVNAFTGQPSVDVLLNFASLKTGIAFKSASTQAEVTPSDAYTVSFATPGGVSVIASASLVKLEAGMVYTIYGFGSAGAAELRVVRDR